MTTSSPSRKTSARKPSHFGSKIHPSPRGSSPTRSASIGKTGGATGNCMPACYREGASVRRRRVLAARARRRRPNLVRGGALHDRLALLEQAIDERPLLGEVALGAALERHHVRALELRHLERELVRRRDE